MSANDLKIIKPNLENQKHDMESLSSQNRSAKKLSNYPPASLVGDIEGRLGLVTDLAYVSDLHAAQVLSWATGKYMDAVVVRSARCAATLYDRKVKSWALEDISQEKKTTQRPSLTGIPGNPKYLVRGASYQKLLSSLKYMYRLT